MMNTDYELAVLLNEAVKLAVDAHEGQEYDGGPYIFHPLRVMLRLKSLGLQIVGVLHDVLEDTPNPDPPPFGFVSYRQKVEALLTLRYEQPGLLNTLQAVSRHAYGEETYKEYIRRVLAAGLPARLVKLADLADNSNPNRVGPPGMRGMISDRYVWASALLATGDEEYADHRKKDAALRWKHHGEHPGKFVLTPEVLELRVRAKEEPFDFEEEE